MRLSSMADYAVVTMCAAARHCGGGRIAAADLATETGLPLPTVQKLVSLLAKGGLLKSTRGAGGGIQLARPAAAISLADVVEVIEGPIALTHCVETSGVDCALEGNCTLPPHWGQVNRELRRVLASMKLDEFSRPAPVPTVAALSEQEQRV